MTALTLDRLTDRQLECLRLAARPMTSKEIGRELAISPRTVEGHLDKAVQLLGASSRLEAVRLLGQLEDPTYKLRAYPPHLARQPQNDTIASSDHQGRGEGGSELSSSVRETQTPFNGFFGSVDNHFPLPFPTGRRQKNDLTILQRVGWTFAIIIGLALATGFLLSSLSGISTVAKALWR